MIELGVVNRLKVKRLSDLGYMLTDGTEEVLLHFKEALKEYIVGEDVDAYIYTDKENRKTATTHQATLEMGKPAFTEVVGVINDVGVFVANNTPKDLLVSKDYLPYDLSQWPIVGDVLYCGLKIKKNYLVAKPLNRYNLLEAKKKVIYEPKQKVEAFVNRFSDKGIGLISKDAISIFVPNTQLRKSYRMGELVEVTITKMLDYEAYGTLNEQKEILMKSDEETILNYLKVNKEMNLTAKSCSQEVERFFNMSRKAFKRAYGALYREQKIYFDEEKTYLK